MKKRFTAIMSVLVMLLSLFLLPACNWFEGWFTTAQAEAVDSDGKSYAVVQLEQKAKPNADYKNTEISWYDSKYNYYVYNLGTIVNVPLTSTYTVYSYNGGQATYTEEITKTTVESIETQTARSISSSVKWSMSTTMNIKTSLNVGEKDVIDAGVEAGFSQTITNDASKTKSWSETVTNCVTKSTEQKNTLTLTFNDSCKHGYYLYLHLGHIRVYGAIIQSRSNPDEIYAQTYNEIYANQFSLHYNGDSHDFPIDVREKIEFDLSSITKLEPPTKTFEEQKEESYPPKSVKATQVVQFDVEPGSHTLSSSMKNYYDEYFYQKGYNRIKIHFSLWLKCNGSSNKIHGDLCYSENHNDCLYYFQEQTKKEWKWIENTVDVELRLFSDTKTIYLIFRNDNWLHSCTIKDVTIEYTLYKA